MKKTYGYARVSTREQHLDRQLKTLMDAGVEERDIITDKVSGKDLEREGYQSLKNHFLRDGDNHRNAGVSPVSCAVYSRPDWNRRIWSSLRLPHIRRSAQTGISGDSCKV